jgi:acyl-CoA reductase-like NAD-dependent aldehyde dehydrogenase
VNVDNSMRIAQEEIFGPVYCVIPYIDVDDAVGIANHTPYGLEASVWTSDPDRDVDVGCCPAHPLWNGRRELAQHGHGWTVR